MKNFIIKFFIVILIIIIGILLYGSFIEPSWLVTNEIKIVNNDITDEMDGLKVVHISDIHYGTTVNKKMLKKIVDEINLIKPDILVFTGDLFDDSVTLKESDIKDIIDNFKNIKTNNGKYAIYGDMDDKDKWDSIMTESDFESINDTSKLIFNGTNIPIVLSGISSNSDATDIIEKNRTITSFIEELEVKPCYSILLMHEPDYVDTIDLTNYNLVLAGHSLGGIYIPFAGIKALPSYATKYYAGKYEIGDSILYVSTGVGTNKTKFRFMNRPSINFYRIVKGNTN